MRYPGGRDARHAAVIDGTFAELAGGAIDGLADNAGVGTDGTGADVVGGAEDGEAGSAGGVGDVHGAAVVGEHE